MSDIQAHSNQTHSNYEDCVEIFRQAKTQKSAA